MAVVSSCLEGRHPNSYFADLSSVLLPHSIGAAAFPFGSRHGVAEHAQSLPSTWRSSRHPGHFLILLQEIMRIEAVQAHFRTSFGNPRHVVTSEKENRPLLAAGIFAVITSRTLMF